MLENAMRYLEALHPVLPAVAFWLALGVFLWACVRVFKWLKRILVAGFFTLFGQSLCKHGFHDYSKGRSIPHHDVDLHYEECSRCGDERSVR